jgi:hypothetical protein
MRRRFWLTIGGIVLLLIIFGGSLVRFYTDWLWFGEVGYRTIFWTELSTQWLLGLVAGVLFFLIVYANLWLARRLSPPALPRYGESTRARIGIFAHRGLGALIVVATLVISVMVGLEASTHWMELRAFMLGTPFPGVDPIFHKNIGFYVFRLGFMRYAYGWLFFAFVVAGIAAAIVHYADRAIEMLAGVPTFAPHVKAHLSLILAGIFLIQAWRYCLDAYGLLYSPHGFIFGAGYTDVHARLFAYRILGIIAVVSAVLSLVNIRRRGIMLPAAAFIILIGTSLLVGVVYPLAVEEIYVKPDQVQRESSYIKTNIQFTRDAYNLAGIEEKDFPHTGDLTPATLKENSATINSIRLWDYRPLLDTYSQLQTLWQYFDIEHVDVDRYKIGNEVREVMLSARELSPDAARSGSGTWVNQHFRFTHGYGAVMSPVNKATPEGLPELFVQDMPPVSSVGIDISKPQIYYGELADDYVIVNSDEKEFDYPSGDEQHFTKYNGNGGIPIGGYLNRLAFAWLFGDSRLVLQNPISAGSRLMYRRQIRERVTTICPFLRYDSDPYVVVSNGKLYWMMDAYTTSSDFPYSAPYDMSTNEYESDTINYIRNSVKVVVDAYSGKVDFYVADAKDPIIGTYSHIFPGVFKPIGEMPADLREHVRYPEQLFKIQSDLLLRYHMRDPEVFYSGGDLWAIPNEIVQTSGEPSPIEPYYVVMRLPGEKKEHFVLMRPFTPYRKDNMVSWMATICDPDDYGRTVLYQFPRGQRIYGPQQIESRINQDPTISQELTLWDQAGSKVNRGNLIVLPIDGAILYIKPLYLQATSGKIPELKRVIVAYNGQVVMEDTLEAALNRIFGSNAAPASIEATAAPMLKTGKLAAAARKPGVAKLIDKAVSEFNKAKSMQQKGDWSGYGDSLKQLESTLRQLKQEEGG